MCKLKLRQSITPAGAAASDVTYDKCASFFGLIIRVSGSEKQLLCSSLANICLKTIMVILFVVARVEISRRIDRNILSYSTLNTLISSSRRGFLINNKANKSRCYVHCTYVHYLMIFPACHARVIMDRYGKSVFLPSCSIRWHWKCSDIISHRL